MKRILSMALALSFFLFIYSSALAQSGAIFKSLDDIIPPYPGIKIGKLSNGLTYYILQNKKPENRMTLRMPFKVGSNHEDDDQKGLAHFVEHLAFNGTKNFPKNELIDFLEKTGVRFGADLNAHTWFNETVYKLQLPTDDKELMNKGFQIFEDWMHNIVFIPEEIDKERGVVMEEWRLRRGGSEKVMLKHLPVAAFNSRYVDRYTIGDTNVLLHAPYDAFSRYYYDWYRPDMAAVIAVGDFDVDEVEGLIKKHFAHIKMPAKPRKHTEYTVPAHKDIKVSIATDKELTYPRVDVLFKHPDPVEGSYRSYRHKILINMISGMLGNRLNELTQKTKPPFLAAFVYDGKYIGAVPAFTAIGILNGDNLLGGYKVLLTELFRAYQHGFTQSEFDRQKKESLRGIDKAYDERGKTESRMFADEYIRNFFTDESIPGIAVEKDLYHLWIPEFTLDDINTVIHELIRFENVVILLGAPEIEGSEIPGKNELVALFKEVSASKIPAYEDVVIDKPLFDRKITPGTIASEKRIDNLDITELTLSNGMKVILKPTTFKDDEVLFSSYSSGGTSLAPDADYLSAAFASSIVNQSGIGEFDNISLEKVLSGKIVSVYPSITELYEGISGSGSPKDIETMFQLINLHFTAPRKDKEAFESFISKVKQQIINSQRRPDKPIRDTIKNVMSSYSFRARPLTEERLAKVNLDKAYGFYIDRFKDASDFTFIFVGSFTPDNIKPLINKYLGSLPNTGRKETWKDLGVRPPKQSLERDVHNGIEPKSNVTIIMNGDFEYNHQNRYFLQSLCNIANRKLRELLREEKGGVYGVYAYPRPSHYPYEGYQVRIGFGCNPERVDELIADVKSVVKDMIDNKPDEKNMTKEKETQRKTYEVNMKENRFWSKSLRRYYYNNWNPELILDYLSWVDNLSDTDINNAAKKYFNMDSWKQFVLYPAED